MNRHEPFHLATSPGEAGSGPLSMACAAQWARGERRGPRHGRTCCLCPEGSLLARSPRQTRGGGRGGPFAVCHCVLPRGARCEHSLLGQPRPAGATCLGGVAGAGFWGRGCAHGRGAVPRGRAESPGVPSGTAVFNRLCFSYWCVDACSAFWAPVLCWMCIGGVLLLVGGFSCHFLNVVC